ncbi:MAG: malto-oligosyltrehalose synthase [Thermoleophilia bacterium]|nr:malto-oligosyltrehalose synthase [Thermoleophilia bacterium]
MRIPTSTYRLQLTEEFGFRAAADIVPYLARLGIGDVYLSPILQAAPGSTHGYDTADPTRLDERLGTRADFDALSAALQAHDMGLLLDIVPNHMAAHTANPWWWDVLEHGPDSEHAETFDIDWAKGLGRLLLPVLGGPLEGVLEAGELSVVDGQLAYYDNRFPLAPGTEQISDLRALVDAQHYELADWREQATRLNYRRFFDVAGLVGVRVELPHVFDATHALVLDLIREGHVTGLRVDHVDGLRDPRAYLERLQRAARAASGRDEPFYVVVEKILAPDELLPESWPIAGMTGYQFLDAADGLFVDRDGVERIQERYREVVGTVDTFDEVVERAKLRTIRDLFWGELGALAARLAPLSLEPGNDDAHRRMRDTLALVTAELPVYRTYIDANGATPLDRAVLERVLTAAAQHPGSDPESLAVIAAALRDDREFAVRWQQFSGPVTAKSVEDTAFYRYYAVPARNEVGVHPGTEPGSSVGAFHWITGRRGRVWPHQLNASSTHDTKRSEDVRARMMALLSRPDEWADTVADWLDRFDAPDRNDGWMVASTLVGAWPLDEERLHEYILKAVREEKVHSSWTSPDEEYEASICAFGERLRTSGEVEGVVDAVRARGERNSLAAVTLKLLAPGVPDIYQGTEVESLTLVDPDNRRPVDYARLQELLTADDEPDKLRLTRTLTHARRMHADLFAHGDYLPLRSEVPGTIAFARRYEGAWLVVAVPIAGYVDSASGGLDLPAGAPTAWQHVVTGAAVDLTAPLTDQLAHWPVLVAFGWAR